MKRVLVVEPLVGGWCRCWELVMYPDGRSYVGLEFWALTSKVLWGVDAEPERERSG